MNLINHNNENDEESRALAACYRLLLQKAAERRARLAVEKNENNNDTETAVSISELTPG